MKKFWLTGVLCSSILLTASVLGANPTSADLSDAQAINQA